jgi:hypothetical protein
MMSRPSKTLRGPTLFAALAVLTLILGASANSARGDTALSSQLNLTNTDPNGQGSSAYSVYYNLPQQAQVGTSLTVPFKFYVDNMTDLESFFISYNVTLTLSLSNGKHISSEQGITSTESTGNLGALELHAGQGWGPVNFTVPLTQANTGLSRGQEVLGNASIGVVADVWFVQPVDDFRLQQNQSAIGYTVISNGAVSGAQLNYPGIALAAIGILLVVVAVATRPRSSSTDKSFKKAPGSV